MKCLTPQRQVVSAEHSSSEYSTLPQEQVYARKEVGQIASSSSVLGNVLPSHMYTAIQQAQLA